jgi:hypothetical protein
MTRIFLALLLSATLAAKAAESPETSFVYYDNVAVVRLLKRMDLLAKARSQLTQPPAAADPNLQEIMRYMARSASDDELYRAIAPTYSRYISINEANNLSKAANASNYAALTKQVQAGEPDYLSEWARAYFMQRELKASKRRTEKLLPLKPGVALPELPLERTGVAAIDAPLALDAEAQLTITKLALSAMEQNEAHSSEDPLHPARLVTTAGIAQSRAEIRGMEERMERFLSTSGRMQSDYLQRLLALITDDKLRRVFEHDWAVMHNRDLDFAEQERSAVGLLHRLLDFAESRLGKIHWDGEELTFDDDDDIALYNAMLDQLQPQNPEN